MKTIKNTITLKLKVNKNDLVDGTLLPLRTLYDMVKAQEEQDGYRYKGYRNALYNSVSSGKYNIVTKYGLKCIDVFLPMVEGLKASLAFEFEVV